MIALWILLGVVGLVVLYFLFLLICSACVSKKSYTKNSKFYWWLLRTNTKLGLACCLTKPKISGKEKLDGLGRFLFVCNHRSNIDPLITWVLLPKSDIAFLSKSANIKIPIFGRIIRKCCFLEIDRQNPRNAIKTLRSASELLKDNQVSIGVYPEGTRSMCKEMGPFHDGVFKVAQFAQVPVVVAVVRGTEKVKYHKLFQSTNVYLDVLEVIPTEKVMASSSHELSSYSKQLMQNFLDEHDKD